MNYLIIWSASETGDFDRFDFYSNLDDVVAFIRETLCYLEGAFYQVLTPEGFIDISDYV